MAVNEDNNSPEKESDIPHRSKKNTSMLLQPPKVNVVQTESIGGSSYAEKRNEFAKKLKKDSVASYIDSTKRKQMHNEPEEK